MVGIAQRECVPISEVKELTKQRFDVSSRYWQLCEKLTIHQAALLILGEDPADTVFEGDIPGYLPLVTAIVTAAESGTIEGVGKFRKALQEDGTFVRTDETDPYLSTVSVDSLKIWLAANGRRPALFFPETTDGQIEPSALPPYLDKEHPRFASKLNVAIEAWEAMKDPANLNLGRTPRQALEAWLMKNATRLGIVGKNGKPIKQAIEEIAKIANWQSQGGAPRTGAKLSSP